MGYGLRVAGYRKISNLESQILNIKQSLIKYCPDRRD